jgi:AraC-like DNA-binding protein
MNSHQLRRVGWHEARAPYERVRLRPQGSFFLACVAGHGRILLDGRWLRVRPNDVFMAPPRVLNAFRADKGAPFVFAWARYEEPTWVKPLVGAASPVRGRRGAGEFARCIAGLREEWENEKDPKAAHHWLALLHIQTKRLATPWQRDHRLWGLWDEVAGNLSAPWTLARLAARVHMSAEHLRRICLKELGRTPVHHVTYIRMQHAREVLETSDAKLEVIASEVGYTGALIFSRAFKRWVGLNPTEYRMRR